MAIFEQYKTVFLMTHTHIRTYIHTDESFISPTLKPTCKPLSVNNFVFRKVQIASKSIQGKQLNQAITHERSTHKQTTISLWYAWCGLNNTKSKIRYSGQRNNIKL